MTATRSMCRILMDRSEKRGGCALCEWAEMTENERGHNLESFIIFRVRRGQ